MKMTRRQALAVAMGASAFAVTGFRVAPAGADEAATAKLMADFAAGKEPAAGKISLNAPEIAENGNTVPISVSVDSKMEGDDMVQSVMLVATGNPSPEVITFNFTDMSGSATATTRIRLAKTQDVVALARMKDGSVFMDKKQVKVTIGGCGG